jgi:NAD(P)-dependent dehydrogenase (short-subunit alcohol dehydrogenase family)
MKNYAQNSSIQHQPAATSEMKEPPQVRLATMQDIYQELEGKVAVISGGDSGIGQAVALLYAAHGIDIAVIYYNEEEDALLTQKYVQDLGRKCFITAGDISDRYFCESAIASIINYYGKIDILINNASVQYPQDNLLQISAEQLKQTFEVNVYGMFFLTQAVLPHLKNGSHIINTTSVTAFRGSNHLVDYAATKGAIVAYTQSLAKQLNERKILVNAVAPGPIITPLIPASFSNEQVNEFGKDTLMGRAGQPYEAAVAYLLLIHPYNTYMTGQVLHPNGGDLLV